MTALPAIGTALTREYLPDPGTARVAILIVGIVLALAVGAPFLLNDAPPSPEAVFATKLCCVKVPSVIAPRPAPMVAPAK